MNREQSLLPIGVFDSGIGGVSVLAEMNNALPSERFIYIADSANAPYGTKSRERVRELSLNIADMIVEKGVKALVVACNTATSVAIKSMRERYPIPVIGMEPAIKPAVENGNYGHIIVMATPLTLKEEKFNALFSRFNTKASIIPLPCPGLVELIESVSTDRIKDYLKQLYREIPVAEVSSIVLGCTHYCFIRNEIRETVGPAIKIVDGNCGTVRHLKRTLDTKGLLNRSDKRDSRVEFLATGRMEEVVPLCQRFLEKYMEQQL